ncbi:MAG: SsrA-binding protein SmpB [Saprospiraceae bacterium]|nr:SsrA-binding protein SmpB [Saprospiraceae bacterium]MBP7699555.1 SsrA-binding protein SmpB [Saprospiraceae bacterium]
MAVSKYKKIEIVNRKAQHEFFFVSNYEAGVMLNGTEVKSVREGNANLNDAYCYFNRGELWLKNMYIKEYFQGTYNNHVARRDRKLLLNRQELKKLERRVTEKGMSIIPFKLYFSERGFAKIEIALAQGKKAFDKRETIKERDTKRELDRVKKMYK